VELVHFVASVGVKVCKSVSRYDCEQQKGIPTKEAQPRVCRDVQVEVPSLRMDYKYIRFSIAMITPVNCSFV